MSLADLFSGINFANTIRKYCEANGWKVSELNNDKAILRFSMSSGRNQTLFIVRYETTLEFSVPSAAIFSSEDNIPHKLSTILLERNAQNKIGFWCIEKLKDNFVYSYMHNVEMRLIDQEYFSRVVKALVNECDRFEEILSNFLR